MLLLPVLQLLLMRLPQLGVLPLLVLPRMSIMYL